MGSSISELLRALLVCLANLRFFNTFTCLLSVGIVGEADENGEDYYLWTYKKLEIGFHGNRIVDVNLTSEGKVKLVPNTKVQMSYSVSKLYSLCMYFAVSHRDAHPR